MSEVNRIKERIYYAAELTLASPLSLSSGEDVRSDSDVLRNSKGEYLIPGSSFAGAFSNYLERELGTPHEFGYSDGEKGRMSAVYISDSVVMLPNPVIRDGVSLGEGKTVQNKFDYEVLETGAKTVLRIERIVREKDAENGCGANTSCIADVLKALDQGDIRLGAKKNRGCGWLKVGRVYRKSFGKDQREEWLRFCEDPEIQLLQEENIWDFSAEAIDLQKYITIEVPLKLTGGISIRRYSAKPGKADYEHITTGTDEKTPVIPGASWSGAIRACSYRILKELKIQGAYGRLIQEWFGSIETEHAHQSEIVIKESRIVGSVPLTVTRNRIDRFDASTIDGALYTEISYFGGRTVLTIKVRKLKEDQHLLILAILDFVIREIQTGSLGIGGLTAIGRGIFEKDGEIRTSENVDFEQCKKYFVYQTEREGKGE